MKGSCRVLFVSTQSNYILGEICQVSDSHWSRPVESDVEITLVFKGVESNATLWYIISFFKTLKF